MQFCAECWYYLAQHDLSWEVELAYNVGQKTRHYTFARNFVKCWQIFKII